jgi:hypothetical protein
MQVVTSGLLPGSDDFTRMLPDNYNLFFYRIDNQFIIYISKFEYPNISIITENSIAYAMFALNYDDQELIIQFIHSKEKERGKGIGYYLMLIIGHIAKSDINIKKITLDDDSTKAHDGSVYKKVGCNYINEPPYPEMECNPLVILERGMKNFKKYKGKGFFI